MKISEALNEFEKVLMNTYKSDGCVTSAITEIHKNIILSAIYKEIEKAIPKEIEIPMDVCGVKTIISEAYGYNACITDFKTNLEEIR